ARTDAVRFGVTTLLDQFTSPTVLDIARADRDAGGATDRSDLFSAGYLATVDGGHGTQYGLAVPTLDGPESAAAWVKARKAEGSDWIKLVVENGWGRKIPTLDFETVGALVEAAHAEDLLAVAHASILDDALESVRRGVDGLVHVWNDRVPTEAEIAVFRDAGVFVVPTLVVLEGMSDPAPSLALAEDAFDRHLSDGQRATLEQRFPTQNLDLTKAIESVRRLAAAGVPILAGSDAPNPSTAMGLSMHREIALLVDAGLTPTQALAAATAVPAEHFRVPERGRITVGALADLVLVEGDPTAEIAASTRLVRVWKAGQAMALDAPAAETAAGEAVAADQTLLADFTDGLGSHFGAGWSDTTDGMMGGQSVVALEVVDGALRVEGELKPGAPFPWAGAIAFLGPRQMVPVDLSTRTEIAFRARGEAASAMLMVFSGDMQGIPPSRPFDVGPEWRTVTVPLDAFTGLDLSTWRALSWNAVGAPGTFHLEIDDVEIR
ncbi:MAG: amidohydrolase family protein, partial [Acidobacteriota bacterium]